MASLDGPSNARYVGHHCDIVAKHIYRAITATPPKTYTGHRGKVEPDATATGHVAKAPPPNRSAATPHDAERAVRPSSFATRSAYRLDHFRDGRFMHREIGLNIARGWLSQTPEA
jgi:hypothetical protein